jgi:hypothetical protein
MLASRGFPCRHIWKVNCHLERNDLELIPITPRWTKDYGSQLHKALTVAQTLEDDTQKMRNVLYETQNKRDFIDNGRESNREYRYLAISSSAVKDKEEIPIHIPKLPQLKPKKRSQNSPPIQLDIKLPRLRSHVTKISNPKCL